MIVKEFYKTRKDGVDLYLTKSDAGLKIRKFKKNWLGNYVKTDEVYDEAIDVDGAPFKYEETDLPIESEEESPAAEVTE